ncbi:MAG: Holliday junction resolvase RuvX [Candidatus Saccharibacteria bacterium]
MPKFLGIDYGEKRIGLAIAGGGYSHAEAATTVASIDEVVNYIHANGPFEDIVMGLPRNMDGDDTHQTRLVREAATHLSGLLGVEIELIDEFDTSNLARIRLQDSGHAFKQEEIDAESAAIILDDFLVGLD